MTRQLPFAVLLTAALVFSTPVAAAVPVYCWPRADIEAHLTLRFGETQIARTVEIDGYRLIAFASKTSRTVLLVGYGIACIVKRFPVPAGAPEVGEESAI